MAIYQFTLRHDSGIAKITLYGHTNLESAKKSIMAHERCPESAILKIEEISLPKTTLKTL